VSSTLDKYEQQPDQAGAPELTVPVLSEELEIRKEAVRTGAVRLHKVVHEAPEMISEVLASENIEVERVPMDVVVDAPPAVRTEGDTTIISVVEEVVVVTKQLRVKEELRITRRQSVSNFYQEVRLRNEEIVVERVDAENSSTQV